MTTVAMDLGQFKTKFEHLIDTNKLNVRLSGVAKLYRFGYEYWSASIEVINNGPIPYVDPQNFDIAMNIFKDLHLESFVLSRAYALEAIQSPDIKLKRWQIMYLFRA